MDAESNALQQKSVEMFTYYRAGVKAADASSVEENKWDHPAHISPKLSDVACAPKKTSEAVCNTDQITKP